MLILLYKTWTPTASIRAVKAETDKKHEDRQTTVNPLAHVQRVIKMLYLSMFVLMWWAYFGIVRLSLWFFWCKFCTIIIITRSELASLAHSLHLYLI